MSVSVGIKLVAYGMTAVTLAITVGGIYMLYRGSIDSNDRLYNTGGTLLWLAVVMWVLSFLANFYVRTRKRKRRR